MADNVSKNRIYLLLTLLIVISYYHTIHYPFFFDDAPNITGNINLQADTFSEIDFKKNFFQSDGGISLRPLSYLSFALNWVISGKETWSYHLVNILIHIVSVLVLLKTILLLFQTPVGRKISNSDECVVFAAVIATVLWALNPVQTQAVTYIVQRMASLAGMFCIISIFFYLKARIDFSRFSKINVSLFCLSVVFFFAGFFSKENAAILPLLILLIEFIFFGSFKNKKYILFGVAALVFIFLFAEIFSGRDIIQKIVQGYDDRPFNIYERFLTEFRILFFYLTQIFYPIPQRLSLLHSIEISKSLFDPITTFLCILFFVFLLIFAIYKRDKFPFISFAILFYIFAHMIESTIIPLELIFEHRNYLSSMFLFLPFSYYFYKLIDFYRFQKKNKLMEMFLYGFVVCLVIGFGTATYIRNSVWSSQKSLWEDSLEKSDTMRGWHNLGFHYYGKKGLRQIEKNMYLKAIEKPNMTRISGSMNTYANLANMFYQDNEIEKAEYYFKESLKFLSPDSLKGHKVYMGLSLIEAQRHNYNKALAYINESIQRVPLILYYNLKGTILMRLNDEQKALKNFMQGVKREPYRWEGYFYLGAFLTELGYYQRGFWFLKQASQKTGVDHVKLTLYIIHNRLMADDQNRSFKYADSLLKDVSYGEIIKKITHIKMVDYASIPLDVKSILDVFEKKFLNKTKQIKAGLIES